MLKRRIVTLSEGDISELHIGLKGTMGALYLKELAQKTHRGLEGRALQGKSAGGNSYGYDVVRSYDTSGAPIRGERVINAAEAEIIQRIFEDYARGVSPKRIAFELNKKKIPGPMGLGWGQSHDQRQSEARDRDSDNELYIGRQIWNRHRFLKDPDTGKRVCRPNPEDAWIITEVPATADCV